MDNIIALHRDLKTRTYHHSPYHQFIIADPKPRLIHKATVRDRVVHRAVYRALYWHFHPRFIHDSYSCRLGRGTHKALDRFRSLAYQASQNHTKTLWVLKCDIKKFFTSIDQTILLNLLQTHVTDPDSMNLIREIISSFHSTKPNVGLPLGNLTSQLFANVYLDELDQFIKHDLKQKFYVCYADDFLVLSLSESFLTKNASIYGSVLAGSIEACPASEESHR